GDRAVMHEKVFAAVVGGDEPVPLLSAEPLHSSSCHLTPPLPLKNGQRTRMGRTRNSLSCGFTLARNKEKGRRINDALLPRESQGRLKSTRRGSISPGPRRGVNASSSRGNPAPRELSSTLTVPHCTRTSVPLHVS